jgi:hypothetical protein
MIWTLVRYSPAWRITGWSSLIFVAVWLVLSQGKDAGLAISAPIMIYILHMGQVVQAPETAFRCTFFDAALPVEGRALWVSKMIVLLGMVWAPVLAASAVRFAVMHNAALPFLNATAGYTAVLLFAQCFRIREFHEPRWVCLVAVVVGGTGMIVMGVALPDFAMRVLAACLALSATLFVVALSRVPKSFQAAPAEASAVGRVRTGPGESSAAVAWWKILRPIYGWYLLILVGLVWLQAGGSFVSSTMVVPPVLAMVRTKWRFMAHLPVSMRKLFWAVWGPLPVAILIGYEAAVYFPFGPVHPVILGLRIEAIAWAISLALLLWWIFLFQSFEWRRMRRLPMVLRVVLGAAVPLGVAAAWVMIPSTEAWRKYGTDPLPYFAVKLAGGLPENPVALAAILLAVSAALYWLAERAFCEMEYSATRTVGESYMQRS